MHATFEEFKEKQYNVCCLGEAIKKMVHRKKVNILENIDYDIPKELLPNEIEDEHALHSFIKKTQKQQLKEIIFDDELVLLDQIEEVFEQ